MKNLSDTAEREIEANKKAVGRIQVTVLSDVVFHWEEKRVGEKRWRFMLSLPWKLLWCGSCNPSSDKEAQTLRVKKMWNFN